MGTGSILGVKRSRHGVVHPPPCSAEVKERVELNLYSTSGPSRPVMVTFTLYIYIYIYIYSNYGNTYYISIRNSQKHKELKFEEF